MKVTKEMREALEKENLNWPETLKEIPPEDWPRLRPAGLVSVWRSREYLVQVADRSDGIMLLSVNRTTHGLNRWEDGISWDDLQRLKRECGFADMDAVEVYPPDHDVVNCANMRHLWVLPYKLEFAWRK